MMVELPIALAKAVEARVAIAVGGGTVFGAFAVACEEHVALAALAWQRLVLEQTEALLLGAVEHFDERLLVEVAQTVLGAHEVVARIDVAVSLHHGSVSALVGVGADGGCGAHPVGKRAVEEFHIDGSHIALHPLVEDGTEEAPPLLGGDGALGAYDGRELEVGTADGLEETVEGERMVGVEAVDGGHGVPLDAMLLQQADGVQDGVEGGSAVGGETVAVVQGSGSVDGEAHEEMVFGKKLAPFVVEEGAVSLQAVGDLPPLGVAPLQLNGLAVEVQGLQRGLSAVPCEEHLGHGLRLDVLAGELLEQCFRHADGRRLLPVALPLACRRVSRGMAAVGGGQIVAIGATHVAHGSHGLEHHVERSGKGRKGSHGAGRRKMLAAHVGAASLCSGDYSLNLYPTVKAKHWFLLSLPPGLGSLFTGLMPML